MKKKLFTIAICALALPMLTSCASQNEVASLQYQLLSMNQKMEQMKKETDTQVRQSQASSGYQIDQLEEEIMVLKNQLAATNEVNDRLKQQNTNLESSISDIANQEAAKREEAIAQLQREQAAKEAELKRMQANLDSQQEKVKAIQQARLRDAEKRAAAASQASATAQANARQAAGGKIFIKAEKKKVYKSTTTIASPKPVVVSKPQTTAPKVVEPAKPVQKVTPTTKPVVAEPKPTVVAQSTNPLKDAQEAFDNKDYDTAYSAFDKVAKGNYDQNTTIEALYMMGECRYEQKEYDAAVVRYQDVIRNYPNSPQSASALHKQASSFSKINEKETAQMLYKKVIEKYPNSPEAALSKKELGQ